MPKVTRAQPIAPITDPGSGSATTLIGADDQVDANEYSDSVAVSLGGTQSGEILGVTLISRETGAGGVQVPACALYVFDADPTIEAGATAIDAADWLKVIGRWDFSASDWEADTGGASAHKVTPVAFRNVDTLYFALKNKGGNINDNAAEDEIISLRLTYRRDS